MRACEDVLAWFTLACAVVSAVACGPAARDDLRGQPLPDAQTVVPGNARTCQKVDFVFIVDDSGSMGQEQTALGQAFPQFATILENYQVSGGGKLDYRVAITTTGRTVHYRVQPPLPGLPAVAMNEAGDDGRFRATCNLPRRWLTREDPNVATALSCRANVGTSGPSFEMPFMTTMLALSARLQDTNAGFLRDDALLGVIVLTDEDDCSRRDDNFTIREGDDGCAVAPAEMVGFLDQLKGGRGRWTAAVVAGPTTCESTYGSALAAPRLQQFVSLANAGATQNAVFASICEANIAGALQRALDTFAAACDNFPIE